MPDPMLERKLSFLDELDALKRVLRVNLLQDGSRRENTAEHSWHMAVMAVVLSDYAPPGMDILRALKMALVHDVVEIDAGDTYAFDDKAYLDKEHREQLAADRLFKLLPQPLDRELRALWDDFEEGLSPEARFINALDRLSPFQQHLGNEGKTWKEKSMSVSKLLTRIGSVKDDCPSLWPYMEEKIAEAVKKGWLDPR